MHFAGDVGFKASCYKLCS